MSVATAGPAVKPADGTEEMSLRDLRHRGRRVVNARGRMIEFHELLKTVRRLKFLYLLKYRETSETNTETDSVQDHLSEDTNNEEYQDLEPSPLEDGDESEERLHQLLDDALHGDTIQKNNDPNFMEQGVDGDRDEGAGEEDDVVGISDGETPRRVRFSSVLETPPEKPSSSVVSEHGSSTTLSSTSDLKSTKKGPSEDQKKISYYAGLHKYTYASLRTNAPATPHTNAQKMGGMTSRGPKTPQQKIHQLLQDYKPSPYDKYQKFTISDKKISQNLESQLQAIAQRVNAQQLQQQQRQSQQP
eukprot:ANDGO_05632.mRNA.1 hypothetical protein